MLHELQVLGKFKSQFQECKTIQHAICPHNSWRLIPYESFQLDILVDDNNELNALVADQWLLMEDMNTLFNDGSLEALNVNKRGYCFNYHSPGNRLPRYKYYNIIDPAKAVDPTVANPYFGWYRTVKKYADRRYLMACKNVGNKHQISIAMFLKRT